MRWEHPESIRCDIHCYSGINFSGNRKIIRFFGKGGRQGPELYPGDIRSVGIVAPYRTRVTFITTELEKGWEGSHSWRAIEIREGKTFTTKDGGIAVQIPDIDWLDKPNARRSDPDYQECYAHADSRDDRPAWTYGRSTGAEIKGNVHAILVERMPKDDDES